MREKIRTLTAKMFMKRDSVTNPKTLEAYEDDVDDLLTGIRLHIINPIVKLAKRTAVIFVIANLILLIFGESRLVEDWSAFDRLRYEWKHLRWLINWHVL